MNLHPTDLYELAEIATDIAKKAGEYIRNSFNSNYETFSKEGGNTEASQIFTEVDLKSEEIILSGLSVHNRTYDLGILSEEQPDNGSRLKKDYFWCIDPLDGTLPFTEGKPGFAVSIALVNKKGIPYIGVAYDPINDNLYHAIKDQGLFKNREEWKPLLKKSEDIKSLSFFHDRSFLKHPRYKNYLERIKASLNVDELSVSSQGGGVMNAIWCLEAVEKDPNKAAFYFKPSKKQAGGGSTWDFAATACMFREARAIVSDFRGVPLDLNFAGTTFMNKKGVAYSTDKKLHESISQLYITKS